MLHTLPQEAQDAIKKLMDEEEKANKELAEHQERVAKLKDGAEDGKDPHEQMSEQDERDEHEGAESPVGQG